MTPKERARLRGLANGIDTVLQIGKDGIGDTLIHQADITLEARELIKGRVLDSCMDYTPRTAAETLAAATHSEVVQVIGSKFVLYRQKKEVPKKKPLSRPGQKSKAAEHVRKAEKPGKQPHLSPPFGGRCRRKATEGVKHPDPARRGKVTEGGRKTPPPGADAPPSPKGGGQGNSVRKRGGQGNSVRKGGGQRNSVRAVGNSVRNRPKHGDAPRRNRPATTPKTRK